MRQKIAALSLAAMVLTATGCTGLSYKPAERIPAPKAAGAPLPLTVAVAYSPRFGENHPLEVNGRGIPVDPARSLTEALRGSGLFREVRAPVAGDQGAPAGVDLLITSDYALNYVIDPGMTGKVLLSMLIIPGPFVTFTDTYDGEATAEVRDSSGRTLKQYVEKAKVEPTYQMFSETTADRDSFPKLIQDLAAKLVADLVKDRAFYRSAPPAAAPAAPSDAAGTAPAQATWWK